MSEGSGKPGILPPHLDPPGGEQEFCLLEEVACTRVEIGAISARLLDEGPGPPQMVGRARRVP
ncbi:MAG: hypothetical protein HY713_08375 [candidate division NC10 bacterium]|nr:hypothetical protein [candidate division NC10 bacterium]